MTVRGVLADFFDGVAAKRLSAVETFSTRSNQHELNGVQALRRMLGRDPRSYSALFVYIGDSRQAFALAAGMLTWYDARERHPSRSEYRLYYPGNRVIRRAQAGDLLVIAKLPDSSLAVIVVKAGTRAEREVLEALRIPETGERFHLAEV